MLKKVVSKNEGTTIVVLALLMVFIMGFVALSIDIGLIVVEKQNLQNAIDATVIAAAQELPDTLKATEVANQYIQLNGYTPDNIVITFEDSDTTIHIDSIKNIEYTFAKFLGFTSKNINSKSGATTQNTLPQVFDYALFSGSSSDRLSLNGSNYYIDGNTHTNKDFRMNGSNQTITGNCEAVSGISINGSNINIPNKISNASHVDMPDFSEKFILKAQENGEIYLGNKSYNSSNINIENNIYIDGNVSINGSNFTGTGGIIASGDITFNGSNLTNTTNDAVCFYSINGDININGSNANLDGILYAPNGKITLNGSNQTINGRVIGNQVRFNGSNSSIIAGVKELESIPASQGGGVKLIK